MSNPFLNNSFASPPSRPPPQPAEKSNRFSPPAKKAPTFPVAASMSTPPRKKAPVAKPKMADVTLDPSVHVPQDGRRFSDDPAFLNRKLETALEPHMDRVVRELQDSSVQDNTPTVECSANSEKEQAARSDAPPNRFDFIAEFCSAEKYADVKFVVGETTVHAHRIVVGTYNQTLEGILERAGEDNFVIDLSSEQVTHQSLLTILALIYHRTELTAAETQGIETSTLFTLVDTARFFGIGHVTRRCQTEVCQRIKANAAELIPALLYSDRENDDVIYEAAIDKIKNDLTMETFYDIFQDHITMSQKESLISTSLALRIVKAKSKAAVALSVSLGANDVFDMLLDEGEDPACPNENDVHPLQLALEHQNDYIVKKLIASCGEASANVVAHGTEEEGETLLHVSTMAGNVEHCKILLDAGAAVNARNSAGRSPLHYATLMGNAPLVELLLEKNAIPNLQDEAGLTAAHVIGGDPLFQVGMAINVHGATTPSGKHRARVPISTPKSPRKTFRQIPESAMIDCMQHLVNSRANFHMPDQHGRTPLHTAAYMAPPQVVAQMLTHGGDLLAKDYFNDTPLHVAMRAPYHALDICKLILTEMAGVNGGSREYLKEANRDGNAPLHIACQIMHRQTLDVLGQLLAGGADVNALNLAGHTALHVLADQPDAPNARIANAILRASKVSRKGGMVVDEVIDAEELGIDSSSVGEASSASTSPMGRRSRRSKSRGGSAVQIEDLDGPVKENRDVARELIRMFARYNANVNAQSNDGMTALHFALFHENDELAYALVRFGASLGLVDKLGRTPTQAMKGGERDINSRTTALLSNITQPPYWVPDDIFDSCMTCNKSFSTTVRRHHCRHCGRLICGKCSPKKIKITKPLFLDADPSFKSSQRVCSQCYDVFAFPLAGQ